MKTVRDVLKKKGNQVWSVSPAMTVYDTLLLMADHEIGAVLVIEAGQVVGIFSEREYARHVVLKGRASKDTLISDVMVTRVVFVRPDQSLEDCMALMTDKRVRHLPVLHNGALQGLVSIGDIVKETISEKEFLIEQLANYIQRG